MDDLRSRVLSCTTFKELQALARAEKVTFADFAPVSDPEVHSHVVTVIKETMPCDKTDINNHGDPREAFRRK